MKQKLRVILQRYPIYNRKLTVKTARADYCYSGGVLQLEAPAAFEMKSGDL